MTADELEIAVAAFVAASGVATVFRGDVGAATPAPPYAVVSLVSDEDDGGLGDAIYDPDTGVLVYSQQRLARVQVSVIGGAASRNLAQRIGLLWRTDCAAARAAVASGIGPTRAAGLTASASVRGGSGLVRSASIDLLGYHRLTLATDDNPAELVDLIDVDLTGVDGPDIAFTQDVPPPT